MTDASAKTSDDETSRKKEKKKPEAAVEAQTSPYGRPLVKGDS